jgi:SAM-dependent methyltransferase
MLYSLLQKPRNRLRAWRLRWQARRGPRLDVPLAAALVADCRLCGAVACSHDVLGLVALTHAQGLENTAYRLLQCKLCDVVYLDPLPSPADLKTLYEGTRQFEDMPCADPAIARRTVNSYARRLAQLRLFPAAGESILEIGAGLAWISQACKQRDARVRTIAQDISAECVDQCTWVDEYIVGPLENVPADRSFRLVSLTHVIEHLTDPGRLIAQLAGYLAPGGHAYFTAPFRPPLWQPRDGLAPWLTYGYLHVPAHISYLSRRWFERVATANGLELIHWDDSADGHQVFEAILRRSI